MGADAYDFADVKAEFANVGSSFAADFEENVAPISLDVVNVVDAPGSKLPLNGGTQGRTLINFVLKLRQNRLNLPLL